MKDVRQYFETAPWAPRPTQLAEDWVTLAKNLAQQVKGSPRVYVLDVKYDAQKVGDLLCSWGLPWPVVMAGYLWEHDEDEIRRANLKGTDQVFSHIREATSYARYIEDENLPPLLSPPYRDVGALLVAVAIYFEALKILQLHGGKRPYAGMMMEDIKHVGRMLLNIAKRLGLWKFKRDIEDLTEQLQSPDKFEEESQEHEYILNHDIVLLEQVRQLLASSYEDATKQPVKAIYTACGVEGLKRRLQDAHTTVTSHKSQLTGLDLVTFEIIVPTVEACYTALGVFSLLGQIQDRVTDLIANPKPNGCSHIALGLTLKAFSSSQTQKSQSSTEPPKICQLQISTHIMQAVATYGCLHPYCYPLYMAPLQKAETESLSTEKLLKGGEGRVFQAIKDAFTDAHTQYDLKAPIAVYDKNRKSFTLPVRATALDFAFAVDSTMGEHAVEAFINNRKAPLNRILDSGDIVEIRTSKESQTQDYWLDDNYAITPLARQHIRESLNQRSLEFKGYKLLYQALENKGYILTSEELGQELRRLLEQHNLGEMDTYLEQLAKTSEPPYSPDWAAQEIMKQLVERNESLTRDMERAGWIPVLDIPLEVNHQLRLCGSCRPMYPRNLKIMGRLRVRSNELIVHKASCHHLVSRSTIQQFKPLSMTWQPQLPTFRVAFFVIAQDRTGLVNDITKQLRRHQCTLLSIKADAIHKFREAHIHFTVETYADQEVLNIWQKLSKLTSVMKVEINAATTSKSIYDRLQQLWNQNGATVDLTVIEPKWEEDLTTLESRSLVLKNPFDISRPAAPKMFFGRSKETKFMQRELCEDERGKALVLFGPRRSGKSSICKNFLESHVRPPFWGVLFSLQNFTHHNEETILRQLAQKICAEFHEQLQQPVPDWESYSHIDPQLRFRHILQDCITRVPGTRLVLALDEFGGALESFEKKLLDYRFFTYWKELMNELPQLSLILSLPASSHRLLTTTFSNAFSFAGSLPVMFLDQGSARRLLADPFRDQHIVLHPNTIGLAIKLTGGNPYYMTLIGQYLIDQLNLDTRKQLVTDEDLHQVIDQIIKINSNPNFDFHYKEIQSDNEMRALKAIVEITNQTNQTMVSLKTIAGRLKIPHNTILQDLERLRNGLILEESTSREGSRRSAKPYYSFRIELVRLWLDRNRWFFSSLM